MRYQYFKTLFICSLFFISCQNKYSIIQQQEIILNSNDSIPDFTDLPYNTISCKHFNFGGIKFTHCSVDTITNYSASFSLNFRFWNDNNDELVLKSAKEFLTSNTGYSYNCQGLSMNLNKYNSNTANKFYLSISEYKPILIYVKQNIDGNFELCLNDQLLYKASNSSGNGTPIDVRFRMLVNCK